MNACRRALAWLAVLLCGVAMAAAIVADTVVYYHTDALHSVTVVTNAQGQVIERTHYAPYGAVLNRSLRDGPGYGGHEEDAATGLVYMQQRYYDPQTGRFLSADSVQVGTNTGANFNRYWYANDNPYRYTDPDGRQVVIIAVGACVESGVCEAAAAALLGTAAVAAAKHASDKDRQRHERRSYYDHVMQSKQDKAKDGSHQSGGKVKETDGKRPFTDEPGSIVRGRDGSRKYGGDGYPETDRDRPHPSEKGKQGGEDHSHDWGRPQGGGRPSNEHRGPSRAPKPSDPPPPREKPKPPREIH